MSVALMTYLKPLMPYLDDLSISEICINQPETVWLERQGQFLSEPVPALTANHLQVLAELIAEHNHKSLSAVKPLLSATLPSGARCQIVLPPLCDKAQMIFAIRKQAHHHLTLDEWEKAAALATNRPNREQQVLHLKDRLRMYVAAKQWKPLIIEAVRGKLTILISGGTSTAKTTFLNACLNEVNQHERLITVEGVREIKSHLPNSVHLLANEDETGEHTASMLELLKVSLRLRPDRLFIAELRGQEAYPFLRACLSGHPGSLTTLHASSVTHAFDQLRFMLAEAPELRQADNAQMQGLMVSAIDLVVQMARTETGTRLVEDVYLTGVN